jgi:hypothetical protein
LPSTAMNPTTLTLILQTLLSFLIGATTVALATTIAERVGSTLGGVIGGMPSTVVVTLFFIAIMSGDEVAASAAGTIPLVMGFCGVFLVCYVFLSQKMKPGAAILLSLLSWFILSSLAYLFQPLPFGLSLAVFGVLLLVCGWLVQYRLDLPTSQGNHLAITFWQMAGRGAMAGVIIACAVLAAKLSGPALGAILAGFPAIMSTTMWISSRSRGVVYSHALVTPLLYSCMINVTVYALLARFLYPSVGVIWGTLVAYAGALVSAYLVFQYLKRLTSKSRMLEEFDQL